MENSRQQKSMRRSTQNNVENTKMQEENMERSKNTN